MHRCAQGVEVDRSVDRKEEASTAEDISKPGGRLTGLSGVTEKTIDWLVDRKRSRSTDRSTGTRN